MCTYIHIYIYTHTYTYVMYIYIYICVSPLSRRRSMILASVGRLANKKKKKSI